MSEKEKLRMDAYYYSFGETGCINVDKILSAVASAGKAYHHTDNWNQSDDGEPTQIDYIQDAACAAAERIKEIEQENKQFKSVVKDLIDGLKHYGSGGEDKNGVEIYAGDIVKCSKTDNLPGNVIFKNGIFCILDRSNLGNPKYRSFACFEKTEWEIIGNVHENPELLK